MSDENRPLRRVLLACGLSVALVLTSAAVGLAQEPQLGFPSPTSTGLPGLVTGPEDLRQQNPGCLVRADVNRGTRSYREGDTLSITIASEADAYVYVLYKQADGQVFVIFPNSTRPNNRVQARQALKVPSEEDLLTWVVGPPFGKETIKVLASKEPLEGLSDPAMRAKFFNPVSTTAVKGIQLELGKRVLAWTEDSVEITTYPAGSQQEQGTGRRLGVFVGLGQYEHIARTRTTSDGKKTTVYQPSHRDARTLAGVLQEVGQLSEVRLLTNAEATRTNVEEAIAKWLPSATRPGDTAIIFFSGMAMPISQAAGTQDSGIVLPLYEFMMASTLKSMRDAKTSGKLSGGLARQLQVAEQLVQQAGSEERGTAAVVRQWGVTDDTFAHWLQGLAGRQVIVLLDTPYASAFGPQQGSSGGGSSGPMAQGVSRLKGLGQQEIALLGANGQQMFDVQRDPQGLSLMTELLIASIRSASGTLTLEQAYQDVSRSMETRLAEINRQLQAAGKETIQYRPYLVSTCTRQVYLKP